LHSSSDVSYNAYCSELQRTQHYQRRHVLFAQFTNTLFRNESWEK